MKTEYCIETLKHIAEDALNLCKDLIETYDPGLEEEITLEELSDEFTLVCDTIRRREDAPEFDRSF